VTYRNKVSTIILISIILFIILYFVLDKSDRKIINIISIAGFILSGIGIAIAYIQILSIKQIAKQTRTEVINNTRLNNNLLMLSDLSRKAAMVDEIQGYLRDNKIELCILRMKDLKIILNALKNQEYYSSLFSKKEFRIVFEDFNIDLDNFQRNQLNQKYKLDKDKIITNLEALSTLLLSLEIKLKTLDHDS
jgi:hypothetical protein